MASRPASCRRGPPLGQHFLRDRSVLAREIAYAEIQGDETVLEIGPGPGALTQALLGVAGRVVAIEKDRGFQAPLEGLQRRHPNLELVWGDALEVELPKFDKVVANLPFSVALPLTHRLLEQRFDRAVLMYQHRLAERICAGPGERGYCRLGIAVGRRADVQLLEVVRPSSFTPPPEVDSALVLLRRIRPRFSVPDEALFRVVLEGLFASRDLSLGQALPGLAAAGLDSTAIERVAARLSQRELAVLVYAMTPKSFGALCRQLWEHGARAGGVAEPGAGAGPVRGSRRRHQAGAAGRSQRGAEPERPRGQQARTRAGAAGTRVEPERPRGQQARTRAGAARLRAEPEQPHTRQALAPADPHEDGRRRRNRKVGS